MVDAGGPGAHSRAEAVVGGGVVTVPPPPPASGLLVAGRYRLVRRIGAGGMATIFRARDVALDRDVAVKLLHAHLADDPEIRARFRTEGRHAAGLVHPHIVGVYDQGVAAVDHAGLGAIELPYLVLELVDGPSLRDVLDARGRLPAAEALAVVEPVAAALARAHTAGVVHRDVKPENVLVSADGTVKVADFGIARALAATRHTATGALVGSVHYLAPELVAGGDPSPASDQYALGVVCYELLTGRKPLPADSPMAVVLRHARERIPAPSRDAGGVTDAVDRVVGRATDPDPSRRYRDVTAFAAALGEAVGSGPRPVTLAGPGRGSTLVIPPAAAETLSLAAADELGDRRSRRDRRDANRSVLSFLGALVALGLIAGSAWLLYDLVLFPRTAVPDVVGLTDAAASAALADVGLDATLAEPVADRRTARDTITRQEPAPSAVLRRGGAVLLVPSSGPALVPVPVVTGLSRDEAVATLEAAPHHHRVRVVEAHSDTVPEGAVTAQEPGPGTPLAQDAAATITVSLGVAPVAVPDVDGLDATDAEAAVAAAGLRAEVVEAYRDDEPQAGRVAAQSPAAGAEVDPGTTVTVTVSAGAATVRVPDVEGRGVDDAVARLDEVGLTARVVEEPRPSFGPFRTGRYGRVEAQLPAPGERVARGEVVDLATFSADAEGDRRGRDADGDATADDD